MATVVSVMLLVFFTFFSLIFPSKADVLGFSADLIHRDSPASPYYDPSLTPFDHALNTLQRSHNRVKHFIAASKNVHSTSSKLIPSFGEYLMKITLGTPPFTIFAIPDTGSDLTWVQCAPCTHCYKQKAPLFYPKKSSTYKTYSYNSSKCQSLDTRYNDPNGTCGYEILYGSGSSRGTLASETLTLGSNSSRPVYFPQITIGCGYNNSGIFKEDQAGLVGLGGGSNSLISQIKPSINAKFSYCLTPTFSKTKTTGQINFGNNVVVSGEGAMSTPIIPGSPKTYYLLNLDAISVGKRRIELFNSTSAAVANAGNIFIDSGTTLTYLDMDTYFKFLHLVKKAMGRYKSFHVPSWGLDLCYRVSDKPSYPRIKAHFTGATIHLKPINTFIQIGNDTTCLAFVPTLFSTPIYGNIAQTNFLVGYDTAKGTVTFKPSKCGYKSH